MPGQNNDVNPKPHPMIGGLPESNAHPMIPGVISDEDLAEANERLMALRDEPQWKKDYKLSGGDTSGNIVISPEADFQHGEMTWELGHAIGLEWDGLTVNDEQAKVLIERGYSLDAIWQMALILQAKYQGIVEALHTEDPQTFAREYAPQETVLDTLADHAPDCPQANPPREGDCCDVHARKFEAKLEEKKANQDNPQLAPDEQYLYPLEEPLIAKLVEHMEGVSEWDGVHLRQWHIDILFELAYSARTIQSFAGHLLAEAGEDTSNIPMPSVTPMGMLPAAYEKQQLEEQFNQLTPPATAESVEALRKQSEAGLKKMGVQPDSYVTPEEADAFYQESQRYFALKDSLDSPLMKAIGETVAKLLAECQLRGLDPLDPKRIETCETEDGGIRWVVRALSQEEAEKVVQDRLERVGLHTQHSSTYKRVGLTSAEAAQVLVDGGSIEHRVNFAGPLTPEEQRQLDLKNGPRMVDPEFKAAPMVTGRMQCKEPNLSNTPTSGWPGVASPTLRDARINGIAEPLLPQDTKVRDELVRRSITGEKPYNIPTHDGLPGPVTVYPGGDPDVVTWKHDFAGAEINPCAMDAAEAIRPRMEEDLKLTGKHLGHFVKNNDLAGFLLGLSREANGQTGFYMSAIHYTHLWLLEEGDHLSADRLTNWVTTRHCVLHNVIHS